MLQSISQPTLLCSSPVTLHRVDLLQEELKPRARYVCDVLFVIRSVSRLPVGSHLSQYSLNQKFILDLQSLMVCACDQNPVQEHFILIFLKIKLGAGLVMSWTVSYRALWTPLVSPMAKLPYTGPPAHLPPPAGDEGNRKRGTKLNLRNGRHSAVKSG